MRVVLVRLCVLFAILAALGSAGCTGDTPISPEPGGELRGINIFNVSSVMMPGQILNLGATGLYQGNATYNITHLASWSSSNPDVIRVIGKGIIEALGGGTATISCSYRGITSQTVTVKVEGPPVDAQPGPPPVVLSRIQVEPTWAAVKAGETRQFEATAVYSDGTAQPVTYVVDWRISDDEPGFIVDADNANAWGTTYGLFYATGPVGTTVVSCEYMGMISNYVTVVVRLY